MGTDETGVMGAESIPSTALPTDKAPWWMVYTRRFALFFRATRIANMYQDCAVRVNLAKRAILREAVRLCITPLLAALSMVDWAVINWALTVSPAFSETASRISFTTVLTRVLTDLLRMRRISFWPARLSADLWLANGQLLSNS
jgi:hypothetical protein